MTDQQNNQDTAHDLDRIVTVAENLAAALETITTDLQDNALLLPQAATKRLADAVNQTRAELANLTPPVRAIGARTGVLDPLAEAEERQGAAGGQE